MIGLVRGLMLLAGLLLARRTWHWVTRGKPRQHSDGSRVDPGAVQAGHETRPAPVMPVVAGIIAIVVAIGVTVIVATWIQAARVDQPLALSQPPRLATPVPPPTPPEPRLEEEPGAQLRAVRAAEDQILTSAAWVDREAGIARIPIDRAIDLLAANPPPSRSAEEAAPYVDAPPSDAASGRALPVGAP